MKVGAIIPAAGRGKRIGASVPKQFLEIQGKPLLHHTLTVFASVSWLITLFLSCHELTLMRQGEAG